MGKKLIFYLDPDERKKSPLGEFEINWTELNKLNDTPQKIGGTYYAANEKIVSLEELPNHCHSCLEVIAYSDEFDSIYCATCDEWKDSTCGDPTCEYCALRPAKPSDCE